MTEHVHVENAEALTGIFGYWPSFHDGEVLSMKLTRDDEGGPSLEARVYVFHRTDRTDDRGFFLTERHTIATLRFTNIWLNELCWFNNSNILSEIEIVAVDPEANEGRPIGVSFGSIYGVAVDLRCDSVHVKAVEPYVQAI